MDNTIILQGSFVSTGASKTITLESGIDWMRVYNYTQSAANQGAANGVEFYWQRGFASGAGWVYLKSNAANAANLSQIVTSNMFTLIDTSVNRLGVLNTNITAISVANPPVVTTGANHNLSTGDVVRLSTVVGAPQLQGFDFTVNYLTATTFSLVYFPNVLAPAGTTANWLKVNYDPIYYPSRRFVTSISRAAQAVVTMSVTHGFQVGQAVRIFNPDSVKYGMSQINGLIGNIVSVNTATNTITLDIDSSAFSAFAFPTAANQNNSPCVVVPVGEDTALALSSTPVQNILSDATVNNALMGMILGNGNLATENNAAPCNGPAGSINGGVGDVMYWVAGKSFNQ